ncbi:MULTISPECIES: Asp-tRNA(Asn)/Glu-tRNA(Gln) amidotransferase subunit GatC [unclassified Gemella]|uniref:Asp-tRNA(Asn)/Glu-tRNA(Gln) amidotransferase subunit GatC n=1 Tax=unclassified Gemella TaxID=2624949 RepID=UPI001C04C60A|nr:MULTISPECIES: Asp-tRNA(Asn)/Glu-tRNA(Gln) amidotransferase subunit GatC [unclassified Gemella]MBU0278689.1 Asp-tRNA(Asn)/Glu-tRNA(Gln) amidotransferase subunit GatC [Gemella sp. zg-1178]QWQ39241.1 Asp-tRNA(Asn)/Glu-tRNA(Gln) amidotransferase subunit GatC [Gemella sp. zg-570]
MSKITKEQVEHIAHLARLEIKEDEVEIYTEQLEKIVSLVENLSVVDTENIKPTYHVLDLVNVFREDVAKKGLDREEVLKNSYEQEAGQFKVPTIIE